MKTNILHLSDLHFGRENFNQKNKKFTDPQYETKKRKFTLEGLTNKLLDILQKRNDWWPDVIIISGDITFTGHKNEFDKADIWLSKFLKKLKLEDNVVLCPGNHDRYRMKIKENDKEYPKEISDSEKRWEGSMGSFQYYNNFAGRYNNSLAGFREIKNLRFINLNSARFSKDSETDRGKLFLGWRDVNNLLTHNGKNLLVSEDNYDLSLITVVVFHHPREWFHQDSLYSRNNHAATFDYLARYSHIMLSGHFHGERANLPTRYGQFAHHFIAGAAYDTQEHKNHCAIYRIDSKKRELQRMNISFKAGYWVDEIDREIYDLRKSKNPYDHNDLENIEFSHFKNWWRDTNLPDHKFEYQHLQSGEKLFLYGKSNNLKHPIKLTKLSKPNYRDYYQESFDFDPIGLINICGYEIDQFVCLIDQYIKQDNIKIIKIDEEYKIPEKLNPLYHYLVDCQLFLRKFNPSNLKAIINQKRIRLVKIKTKASNILELTIQPCRYSDLFATNYCLDISTNSLNSSLRELFAPSGPLLSFDGSGLANNLSCELILLTKDNHIVFQQRTQEVAMTPEKIIHSVSCGSRWEEYFNVDNDFNPYELILGCSKADYFLHPKQIECPLYLMGVTRDVSLGGEPSFWFVGRLKINYNDLQIYCEQYHPPFKYKYYDLTYLHLENDKNKALTTIDGFIYKLESKQRSQHLLVALYFLKKAINDDLLSV